MTHEEATPDPPPKLTAKQADFVAEYFAARKNGTVAYHRVYDCSLDSARTRASELLAKPNIQAAISLEEIRVRSLHEDKLNTVVEELLKIALSDIGDVLDIAKGGLRKNIRPEARQAIGSLEVSVEVPKGRKKKGKQSKPVVVVTKVRMHDKLRAIDQMCRIFGLYNDPLPLEKLLGLLPPELGTRLRQLVGQQLQERSAEVIPIADKPNEPNQHSEPGPDVSGAGGHAGPVAAEVPRGPAPPANGVGVPPGGEELRVGGEGAPPLFDDP
jgi:phage terminase small subunit